MTKYNYDIADTIVITNVNRLTNQLWKLIPMRENEEDWQGHLETLVVEISGLNEVFQINNDFLKLISKLEGLRIAETSFHTYRKTVFETISLLRGMNK